jgi:hypothetical protein
MSRYLLLFLLNLPFILAAVVSQITQYKLGRSSKRRLVVQMVLWILILIGLASAQPVYTWLFASGLTQTESLSLFDVVQITAIVMLFYVANRSRAKLDMLERRVQDLHQEISIRLSSKGK